MSGILNIAVCQTDLVWEAPDVNIRRIDGFVDSLMLRSAPDLIVLPEFFTTGFTSDTSLAEDAGGPALGWMRGKASSTGSAIAGSVPVRDGGRVFNRFYFVYPDGTVRHYDKRHLFRMSGENEIFTPGDSRHVVEYRGWRIAMSVCYDLRFPVWLRNCGNDYDVMLNVASWPASRISAASQLLHARAVENLSYFVFCNRVGDSPDDSYCGGSAVVDYKGRDIGEFLADEAMGPGGGFLCAGLDRVQLGLFREKFPAWMDADRFEIQ